MKRENIKIAKEIVQKIEFLETALSDTSDKKVRVVIKTLRRSVDDEDIAIKLGNNTLFDDINEIVYVIYVDKIKRELDRLNKELESLR